MLFVLKLATTIQATCITSIGNVNALNNEEEG